MKIKTAEEKDESFDVEVMRVEVESGEVVV